MENGIECEVISWYTSYIIVLPKGDFKRSMQYLYWPRQRLIEDIDTIPNIGRFYESELYNGQIRVDLLNTGTVDHEAVLAHIKRAIKKHMAAPVKNIQTIYLTDYVKGVE